MFFVFRDSYVLCIYVMNILCTFPKFMYGHVTLAYYQMVYAQARVHPWEFTIILSCHQHRYPWPSLATPPYRSSLLAGPQGYTRYPHRATVCKFVLVALLLLGHAKGSTGVHHLWARPYFSRQDTRELEVPNSLWLWDKNGSSNLGQTTKTSDNLKKIKKINKKRERETAV